MPVIKLFLIEPLVTGPIVPTTDPFSKGVVATDPWLEVGRNGEHRRFKRHFSFTEEHLHANCLIENTSTTHNYTAKVSLYPRRLGRSASEAAAWREVLERHPGSIYAAHARKRLATLAEKPPSATDPSPSR